MVQLNKQAGGAFELNIHVCGTATRVGDTGEHVQVGSAIKHVGKKALSNMYIALSNIMGGAVERGGHASFESYTSHACVTSAFSV